MHNKKKYVVFVSFMLIGVVLAYFLKKSMAAPLVNDVRVETNSELIYYLKVSYDGVDINGDTSSDSVTSEIKGGNIYVTDKIPEGLTFTGFVTTSDGSIGAVKRGTTTVCSGKVVDDTNESSNSGVWTNNNLEFYYHGLHYNASTRIVSFTVKNLKAGCELVVGIKTKTPYSVDDPNTSLIEKRRDFYNFGITTEEGFTVISNTVHVYMGSNEETLYNVTYQYTGTVPSNAPTVPTISSYALNTKVGVANNAILEGYTFSGWTTTDTTVTNGSFIMPNRNVNFVGSFTKVSGYKVTYQISGIMPEEYILPSEKEYYAGRNVSVDTLKDGDIIGGYRFMGWTSTDVTISSDNDFTMPSSNVVLTGTFSEIKYKVSYAFYDNPLPPNADSLLPSASYYNAGEIINLANVTEPNGYKFLGWYHEDNFTMPDEDIVIYGEWKLLSGTFEPTITKEIVKAKEKYYPGDVVSFKIKVTNTANFMIKEVIVAENTPNAYFVEGSGYNVLSPQYAMINSIPANGSKTLYAKYIVSSSDSGTIENVVEIQGALADNNYELKDKEYKARAEFNVPTKLKICKNIDGANVGNTFQFKIYNNSFETWISIGENECKSLFLSSGTYRVLEIVPQEYELKSVTGAITSNNGSVVIGNDSEYIVTFTNKFKDKYFMHLSGRVDNIIKGIEIPNVSATFDIGSNVNAKIKTMVAGSSKTKDANDSTVTKIMWGDTLPSGFTETEANTISSSESEKPIYIWYDNTIVYLYTEADIIYLNSDSGYMFRGFNKLTNIEILKDLDTSKVTNMERLFNGDSSLANLDISDWDTSNVTNMTSMFYNCSNLTGLDVSKWNTSKVKSFQMTFMQCKKLTSIDVSKWDTSSATDIGQMFRDCTGLTVLDLSGFDTKNVTAMNSTFNGCTNLVTIYVSDKFVKTKAGNNTNMFLNATKLVGGNGTVYSSSNTGISYARIDTASTPGYFTRKS